MCPRGDVFIIAEYMEVKKHLLINEQIELSKSGGCIIEDEKLARNVLLDINYYRFTHIFCLLK